MNTETIEAQEVDIDGLREEIDRLDAEILAAVKRRAEVSQAIGKVRMASGGTRLYDADGNRVLMDPGHIRFAFDIDYQGTPGDPSDDTDVPDSFQLVKERAGRTDTDGRNFCDDLREFTT